MKISGTLKSLSAAALAMTFGAGAANASPVLVTTGQTVGGTTTNLNLTANTTNFTYGDSTTHLNLTNSSGNLVVTFAPSSYTGNDYYFQMNNVGLDSSTYKYAQIDIASVSSGILTNDASSSSVWQTFWQDHDSTIGTPNNSGTTLGHVTPQSGPFSVVIDLTNGGTSTSGASGWGPGTVTNFRLDPFNGVNNPGASFTISKVTFGSALVPEPASLALLGLGGVLLGLRRRTAH